MKQELIELLSFRKEHVSGEEIAEMFGMTRANVWKYIKELRNNGFEIESATNKGYRLVDVGRELNEDTLRYYFREHSFVKNCFFFKEIDSTNDFLKYNNTGFQDGTLVVAKRQLKGRGRRSREFVSDFGGLYFSFFDEKRYADVEGGFCDIGCGSSREQGARRYRYYDKD